MKNLEVRLIEIGRKSHPALADLLSEKLSQDKSFSWTVRRGVRAEEKLPKPDYYVIPVSGEAKKNVLHLQKLRSEVGTTANIVVFGTSAHLSHSHYRRARYAGVIDEVLAVEDVLNEPSWNDFILKMKRDNPLKYNIGIFGSGKLTNVLIEEIVHHTDFNLMVQSDTLTRQGQENIEKLLERYSPSTRLVFFNTKQELVGANPDVIIIANGRHPDLDYKSMSNPWNELAHFSFDKLRTNCEALRGFEGIRVNLNNPPGPSLQLEMEEYDLDPSKGTSIGADSQRARDVIMQEVINKIVEKPEYAELRELEIGDIHVPVFGDHGTPIPDLSRTHIKRFSMPGRSQWSGRSMEEATYLPQDLELRSALSPEVHDSSYFKFIMEMSSLYGVNSITAAKTLKLGLHRATARSVVKTLEEFSLAGDGIRYLSDAVYCHFTPEYLQESLGAGMDTKNGGFFFSPAKISNRKIGIDPAAGLVGASDELKKAFVGQYRGQRQIVNMYRKEYLLKDLLKST